MAWLLGALVFIVFIALMVSSPGFRRAILVILAVIVVGSLGVWQWNEHRQALAERVVKPSELAFDSATLQHGYGGKGFVARVRNNSGHEVKSIDVLVRGYDCPVVEPVDWANCETVAQDEVSVWQSIPPGQVRQVDGYVRFDAMPAMRGRFVWNYKVIRIKAELE